MPQQAVFGTPKGPSKNTYLRQYSTSNNAGTAATLTNTLTSTPLNDSVLLYFGGGEAGASGPPGRYSFSQTGYDWPGCIGVITPLGSGATRYPYVCFHVGTRNSANPSVTLTSYNPGKWGAAVTAEFPGIKGEIVYNYTSYAAASTSFNFTAPYVVKESNLLAIAIVENDSGSSGIATISGPWVAYTGITYNFAFGYIINPPVGVALSTVAVTSSASKPWSGAIFLLR